MTHLGALLSKMACLLLEGSSSVGKDHFTPLGVTAAASAIDTGIQKKIHSSGMTTLIISNKEMNDIMMIVQALQNSGILLKGSTT